MQAADGSLWYLKYAGQVRKIVHDGVTGIPWTGRADDVRLGVYPSPTRSSVHVIYTLPSSGRVEVGVYDLAGRCVQTLVQPWEATAGRHEAIWDGRDRAGGQVPAGIYLVRLSLAGRHVHRRVPIVP
jgi:flagellar hook assembly protein FlgD